MKEPTPTTPKSVNNSYFYQQNNSNNLSQNIISTTLNEGYSNQHEFLKKSGFNFKSFNENIPDLNNSCPNLSSFSSKFIQQPDPNYNYCIIPFT
jgi:hypothetical protein